MKFPASLLLASFVVAQVAAMPSLDVRQAGKAVANNGKGKAGNNAAGTAAAANGKGAAAKGAAAKNGAKGGAAKGGKNGGKDAAAKGKNAAAKGKDAAAKGKDAAAKGKGKDAAAKGKDAAAKGKDAAAKGGKGGDLQSSLTLDPSVIAKGFANDGQDVPADGQVASLTSTNNFINFCATVPQLPITDGKQIKTGSCNPAPIGVIPSSTKMPSSKFVSPKNNDDIEANKAFTISMAIQNLETGNFVNAQQNYFSAPQQLNQQGTIVGHSHVVVEQLTALDQTKPTDPQKFAFFKGLNAAAKGGVLTADVTNGLPAGVYRLASINSAANHQPVIVPIAQHGSLDDAIYFTVGQGKGAANAKGAADAKGAAAGKDAKNAAGKGAAGKDAKNAAGKGAAGKAAKNAAGKGAAGKGAAGKGAAGKGGKQAGGKGAAGKGAAGKGGKQGGGKGAAGKGKVRRFARESY